MIFALVYGWSYSVIYGWGLDGSTHLFTLLVHVHVYEGAKKKGNESSVDNDQVYF